MKKFIASNKKYRPQIFQQVIGQDHVTQTLKNALLAQRLAPAFLFCGPHGTGKTTCARLLAKTINCAQLKQDGEPCNQCINCTQFHQQKNLTIHELDAASHNSVEDARKLTEQVRYIPPGGKKRIFIIDEAHMLSHAAFNALLKTLEEPPSHVYFILATTEKYKIIPTVLSRCQIFDFRSVSSTEIANLLERIAQKEGISYEEEALQLIAQKANGAVRNAEVMLDLVATYQQGQKVTRKAIREHLHFLDYTYYGALLSALYDNKPDSIGKALMLYQQAKQQGIDHHAFLAGFEEHIHYLLLFKIAPKVSIHQFHPTTARYYQDQIQVLDHLFLHQSVEQLHDAVLTYKDAPNKSLHIELALVKIAQINQSKEIIRTTDVENVYAIKKIDTPLVKERIDKKYKANSLVSNSSSAIASVEKSQQVRLTAKKKKIVNDKQVGTPTSRTPIQQKKTLNILSMNTIVNQINKEKKIGQNAAKATQVEPITLSNIKKYWNQYLTQLQEDDIVKTALLQPYQLDGKKITLWIQHQGMQKILSPYIEQLIKYLRLHLKNHEIHIKTCLQQVEHKKNNVSNRTNKEKFQILKEHYPQLTMLEERLQLHTC